jgi:hypothetical protein
MRPKKKVPIIRLDPESPLAKGLMMMLDHKKLRERFWRGEITLDELNALLKERGIPKYYEHSNAL